MKIIKVFSFIYNHNVKHISLTFLLTAGIIMSIRDRLKAKQAAQQPVELEDVVEDTTEELEDEVVAKPKVVKAKTTKTKVEVVEEDDDLEEVEDDDLEDEEEVVVKPKTTKAKTTKAKVEEPEIAKPKATNKPGFLKTRSVPEMKTYDDGAWLPRKEYLNRVLEKFKDTPYAEITKTQLEEIIQLIESATVEILESNDVTLLGNKTKTVITNPRLYAPRESGIPHVKTEYHTQVNSYREVTLKLRYGFETKRGTVDAKGNFVEGKFNNGKFTAGRWIDKETFVPNKK